MSARRRLLFTIAPLALAACARGIDPNEPPPPDGGRTDDVAGPRDVITPPDTPAGEDTPPPEDVSTGECMPGETRPCYSGPAATRMVGICVDGTQTCGSGGRWSTACPGEVLPRGMESCGNGQDDDCDGMADDGCGACAPGETRACYTGPAGTEGVGRCRGGSQTCTAARDWPASCDGEVTPAPEACGNGVDDDCDGTVDNGCGVCMPGQVRPCYTGPAGTEGVGRCRGGSQTCTAARDWPASCDGEVTPAPEVCGNGADEDCDGTADDGCTVRPANDECSGATPITLMSGNTRLTGTTAGATNSAGSCTGAPDVYFRFTLTQREIVYLDTFGSTFDTVLCVVPGSCGGTATGTSDDSCGMLQSQVAVVLDPGTHYIVVDGFGTNAGAFTLNVQHLPFSGTSSNTVPAGSYSIPTNTAGGGNAQSSCSGTGPDRSFFWLTCPGTTGGSFRASTCSAASFDTVLALRHGVGTGDVCNDDGCGVQSSLTATVPSGAGVHVLYVDTFGSGTGGPVTVSGARP